ncbi:hypothetical protein SUGI_1064310 [Cryptomeria japonica]|nr:hypothetical protein SUGI_1064310 [Cryptomeria japonica]
MDVRMKMSRDLSPDLAKVSIQPRHKEMKKMQVVYYLSRGGQLEHPHFMEVVLPYNQELRLRDVTDRLTILRGKSLPSMFSWSYKRSYKSGYVWNDLSEDDILYPADGVEYVLKASELFDGCSEKYQGTTSGKTLNPKHSFEGLTTTHSQDKTLSLSNTRSLIPKSKLMVKPATENGHEHTHGHNDLLPTKLPFSQNACGTHPKVIIRDDDIGNLSTRSEPPHYRPRSEDKTLKQSINVDGDCKLFKSGPLDSKITHVVNAATQTSERCEKGEEDAEEAASKESESSQNSTELSGGEQSPLSSSSNCSGRVHDETHQTKPVRKTVRFEEPNITQSSARFSLLQFISCGSLGVEDNNIQTVSHKPTRSSGVTQARISVDSKNNIQTQTEVPNRTLGEELDFLGEDLRMANAQRTEKEYFSGSIVEMQAHGEADNEEDPKLTRSASYNAEGGSKSEMAAMVETEKEKDHVNTKTKCIPRIKISKKDSQKTPTKRELMNDRNIHGSCSNRFP